MLAREAVDVVHLHGLDFDRYAVPGIVTVHLPPAWYPPEALTRDDVTYVCVSEAERRAFPEKAVVIPNGVDLETFGVRRPSRRSLTSWPSAASAPKKISLRRRCRQVRRRRSPDRG